MTKYPDVAKSYMDGWKKHSFNIGGLTEGFRGYDGIHVIVEAIKLAGKPDAAAITSALWNVKVHDVYGDIVFTKQGPAGRESGQNIPAVHLIKIESGKVVQPSF